MAKSIPTPYMGAANLGDATIGWQRLIVIPCAFAMLLALRFFLYRVKLGQGAPRLRAGSRNRRAAGHPHQPHDGGSRWRLPALRRGSQAR